MNKKQIKVNTKKHITQSLLSSLTTEVMENQGMASNNIGHVQSLQCKFRWLYTSTDRPSNR
jgi:hypothetical protein